MNKVRDKWIHYMYIVQYLFTLKVEHIMILNSYNYKCIVYNRRFIEFTLP